MNFKKTRLLIVILLVELALTLTAFFGRNTLYQAYHTNLAKEPAFKPVLERMHDGSASTASVIPSEAASAAPAETADVAEEMPEGVCAPVVQAVDYGVADQTYMSQNGHYNNDTEGLFAKNGTYYKLQAADADYLNNTLFIGDSRTTGLQYYGGISDRAGFFAQESNTIYKVVNGEAVNYSMPDGTETNVSLTDALSGRTFDHIYISLGVNELGTGNTQQFYDTYRALLEEIHSLQPDAILFIDAIQHVDRQLSSTDSIVNNAIIVQRNEAVSTLANGHNIFYIDENEVICDADGNLSDELSGDGIHLYASAYQKWVDYILAHAIIPD